MDTGERRLAAILVADVVGYTRMVADDEDGTLSAHRAHRNAIDPLILNHGGRIVKGTGDGVLVEFASATSAVRAAVEIQDLMRARNDEIPESRRMDFRIGINLGDLVIDETGDVFGNDVNIAARIEALATPGGVSITNAVYEAVTGKVDVEFGDDGEHELKNIPRPVRVWKVGPSSAAQQATSVAPKRTLATVAVLPFVNMSDDPEQDYFADGITEDLLTALSYDKDLAVVARNSTFAYKGSASDIRVIARELDATHIVEGSVRRAGSRVRVTAQLVDAETGHHRWAERYDRDLADIFAVQDELVDAITARLRPTFMEAAGRRRAAGDARSLDAWDLTIQGQFHVNKSTFDGFLKGIELFDQARKLEPDFVAPIARSAWAWISLAYYGWRDEQVDPWERGRADAEVAYQLDRDDYSALGALAAATTFAGRPEQGAQYGRRMIELNPHAAFGFLMLGQNLDKTGEHDPAIAELTQAWRLGRHDPLRIAIANDLAYSHFMAGNYEAALTWGRQSLQFSGDYLQAHLVLAATYGQLGRPEEGQQHVDAVLTARADFSSATHRSRLVYIREQDRDHFVTGLLKAGLPE